ncbi:MAG TPA: hypothetical protein PK867_05685 [Pirellulales bacterium]|nr:hypothetical protein [Pirellulales bacterium]
MTGSNRRCAALIVLLVVCGAVAVRAAGVAELGTLNSEPRFKPATVEEVRQKALEWLSARQGDDATRQAAQQLWQDGRQTDLLDRLANTFALADERAASLVALAAKPRPIGPLAPQEWIKSEDLPAFERNNLRLVYGRWLAQERLYDEALAQLGELAPADVVDPATLLFYQAVVYHRLLDKEHGLKAIQTLLDNVSEIPHRYQSIAALMKSDLDALKDESLDHISRQMEDVRRRLALGRAGNKVRRVEDDVIAALDKLIKEMEDRSKQSQNSAGAGAMPQPQQAMPDSRIARMQGAGDVDRRRIGNTSGWGDLPPKQREEALQQIGKDFPPHYRDAIEQYFRKLAAETEQR